MQKYKKEQREENLRLARSETGYVLVQYSSTIKTTCVIKTNLFINTHVVKLIDHFL